MITALELRERLQYDPTTGRWIWLQTPRVGWCGKPAGSLDAKGYWIIKIDGQSYKASRLAHLYMTGDWPPYEMDHADGNPWNDVWHNLRPASVEENRQNRRKRHDNKSGVIGVYWNEPNQKWVAQIGHEYLGSFSTIEEATAARDAAALKAHGDFAVLNTKETLQ